MSNSAGSAKVTQVSSRPLETASFRVQSEVLLRYVFWSLLDPVMHLETTAEVWFYPSVLPRLEAASFGTAAFAALQPLRLERNGAWGNVRAFLYAKRKPLCGHPKIGFSPLPGKGTFQNAKLLLVFCPSSPEAEEVDPQKHLAFDSGKTWSTQVFTNFRSPNQPRLWNFSVEIAGQRMDGWAWQGEAPQAPGLEDWCFQLGRNTICNSMYRMHPKSYANCIHINNPKKNWETRSQVMH